MIAFTEYPLIGHLFFAIFFGGFGYLTLTWGFKSSGMISKFYYLMGALNILLALVHLGAFGEGLFNG